MTSGQEKKRALPALLFGIAGLLIGLTGLFTHICVNHFFNNGFMVKHNYAYFTLQTNVFSIIFFAVFLFRMFRNRRRSKQWSLPALPHRLHTASVLYITITMLGFWLLLAPVTGINLHPFIFWDTMLLHTLTPLLAILHWIFFTEHGGLRRIDALRWLLYPLFYLGSVLLLSFVIREPYYSFEQAGKTVELWVPYPFLDPQVMGAGGVLATVLVLAGIFALLGLLYVFLDGKLKKSR